MIDKFNEPEKLIVDSTLGATGVILAEKLPTMDEFVMIASLALILLRICSTGLDIIKKWGDKDDFKY